MKTNKKDRARGNRAGGFNTREILTVLLMFYAGFTTIYNYFEMKTIGTEGFAVVGGGIFLSWLVFCIMDVVTEVWGKKEAIRAFTVAGIISVVVALLLQVLIILPGSYGDMSAAFALIFSNGARTITASFAAFWVGNFINSAIMDRMRRRAKNSHNKLLFILRAVVSSLFGQLVDNMLFCVLAFAPIGISAFEMSWQNILTSVAIGTVLETGIEAALSPLTATISMKLKRKKENEETANTVKEAIKSDGVQ